MVMVIILSKFRYYYWCDIQSGSLKPPIGHLQQHNNQETHMEIVNFEWLVAGSYKTAPSERPSNTKQDRSS
jgi:hypothetical protein